MNDTIQTLKSSTALSERLQEAEARKLEAEATVIEEKVCELKGPNLSHRSVRILGPLGPGISSVCISVISRWNRMDARLGTAAPRTVFLNSPGGRFADAFAMYDVFRVSQAENGPAVTVQTTGLAGTQAAIVMQAASRRVMTPRSWLILTEIQPDPRHMNTSEGEEAVRYLKWLEDRGWKLLLERSKLDIAELKNNTQYGRQWWLSAEQALQYGLIDEIGTVLPDYSDFTVDPALLPQEGDSWETRVDKGRLRKFLAESELGNITNTISATAADKAGKCYLFGEVNTESCTEAEGLLALFAQRGLTESEMVINSPGGNCFDGCGLMDVITQTMAGREFTTTIFGECASMAGFIAMTGKKRVMAKNAAFLIHRVSTMFGMSSSHMADNTRNMGRLEDMLFPYMAERSGGKLPLDELKARCKEHDWWLTADEAQALGLVHEVI